jgi:hypothetical protein
MNKPFIVLMLIAATVVAAGGCTSKKPEMPGIGASQKNSVATETESLKPVGTNYILTHGYEYDESTKNQNEWLSLYTLNGEFVKKIENQHGGFVAGENVYRVHSSREPKDSPKANDVAYIEALSLRDGSVKSFDFTKTKNTNHYNALEAIVAFTVSKDESRLAWQDTNGDVHFAGIDGSNSKIIVSGCDRSASILTFSDDGKELHFYKNFLAYGWSSDTNEIKSIEDIDWLVRRREWIKSPSGRYVAQAIPKDSASENAISITDNLKGEEIRVPFSTDELIAPKEEYMTSYGPIVTGFSSDEKKIVFGFGNAWYQWAGTYILNVDGKNLKLILNNAEPLAYLSDSTILVQSASNGLQIVSMDGKLVKQFPSSEMYLDKISSQNLLLE